MKTCTYCRTTTGEMQWRDLEGVHVCRDREACMAREKLWRSLERPAECPTCGGSESCEPGCGEVEMLLRIDEKEIPW